MNQSGLPQVTRTYQNHTLDSTRWSIYDPRDNGVIIYRVVRFLAFAPEHA
ncbi:MAG: hypothetical protein ACE1ZA_10820 [Pseudomonadales bacterium]